MNGVESERAAEAAARAALEAMHHSRNDTDSLLRDAYEAIRANGEPLTLAQRAIVAVQTDTVDGDIVPHDKITVNGLRVDPKAPRRRKAAK